MVRDRNQTIALYISSRPTANFSSVITSHGSSRWLHMNSQFDAGATLLVTIPFPKRKAVDMKIKLLAGGLEFSLPENENLMGDLALGAISPAIVERIDRMNADRNERNGFDARKDDKRYSKMRILKFRYFIANDTYLAAAENLKTLEEELAEVMPKALVLESSMLMKYLGTRQEHDEKLEDFFKRDEKDDTKRNIDLSAASPKQTTSESMASVVGNKNAATSTNTVPINNNSPTPVADKDNGSKGPASSDANGDISPPPSDLNSHHFSSVGDTSTSPLTDTSLFGSSSSSNSIEPPPKELNLLGSLQMDSPITPSQSEGNSFRSPSAGNGGTSIIDHASSDFQSSTPQNSDFHIPEPLEDAFAAPSVDDTTTSSITTYIPISESATEKSDLLSLAEKIGLLRKKK